MRKTINFGVETTKKNVRVKQRTNTIKKGFIGFNVSNKKEI